MGLSTGHHFHYHAHSYMQHISTFEKSFYPTEVNIKFGQKKKKNQPNCYLFYCFN
jgi:hypothetical protein